MSSVLEGLKQTARDLTTLEINTIIKPNMTARKMPLPGHAILDIAATYVDKLQRELKIPLSTPFNEKEYEENKIPSLRNWSKEPLDRTALKCNYSTFQCLREAANRILKERNNLKQRDRVIIERIKRNADQLGALLKNLEKRKSSSKKTNDSFLDTNRIELIKLERKLGQHPQPRLHPDEIALVHKVWDIGVEEVVMQSTVSLSGDVVNRIQSDLDPQKATMLLEFHREGIVSGTRMWKLITETLVAMTGGFAKLISRN